MGQGQHISTSARSGVRIEDFLAHGEKKDDLARDFARAVYQVHSSGCFNRAPAERNDRLTCIAQLSEKDRIAASGER